MGLALVSARRELRCEGLDLDTGTLAVRESVFEGKFQGPKTAKALRTIPLGSHAVAALSRHLDASTRTEPERSRVRQPEGRAVPGIEAADARAATGRESAGLGRVTWHQFRHHPFFLAQRRPSAGEDRAGAARAREHCDDAGHLHPRRRRIAPRRSDSRGGAIVRRNAPKCSEVREKRSKTLHP
jgi:hypothetical protein